MKLEKVPFSGSILASKSKLYHEINVSPLFFYLCVQTILGISDVSRTFPDREFPGRFHQSYSREIFFYSREFREIEVKKNAVGLELI